jgi:hypothetical protein
MTAASNVLRRLLPFVVVSLLLGAPPAPASAAGDVTAKMVQGRLIVTGDDQGNQVLIDGFGQPANTYLVTGLGGTTINSAPDFLATGVTADVVVRFRGGDNTVLVVDTLANPFPKGLKISSGKGMDFVFVLDVSVTNALRITTKSGDDLIVVDSSFAGGDLLLRTGAGADDVFVEAGGIAGRARLSAGPGADSITTGAGQVYTKAVRLNMGGEDDLITMENATFLDSVRLNGGRGTDTFDNDPSNSFAVPPLLRSIEIVN